MTDPAGHGGHSGPVRRSVTLFVDQARGQVAALERAVADAGPGDADAALGAARGLAHTLAGAAGSMGFPDLGRLAAALEILLEGASTHGPSRRVWAQIRVLAHRVVGRVEALSVDDSSLVTGPGPAPPPAPLAPGLPGARVLVAWGGTGTVEAGSSVAERLALYGWKVRLVADTTTADEGLTAQTGVKPDLVVVDLDALPEGVATLTRLTGPDGPWSGVPWCGAAAQPSAALRMRVVAAGAAGLLSVPLTADAVVDRHADLREGGHEEAVRVLVLEGEPTLANLWRWILEGAGALVDVVDGPDAVPFGGSDDPDEGIWDAVLLAAPDASDGAATLAMALRRDPGLAAVGLVLLVPSPDLGPVASTLARGGDAVMTAPVEPDLLAATVLGQAARAQAARRRAGREGGGPVLLRGTLERRLAYRMGRARALDMPLSVGWLGPGDTEAGGAVEDWAAADRGLARLLRERVRPNDLLGRGPGDGLVVGLPAVTDADAATLLATVRDAFAGLVPDTPLAVGWAGLTDPDAPADETAAGLIARARFRARA
ncbi:Hpt domain-containing protein [Roseospira goensis]|uniref:HPt (Histidine-containing phosphotransfer) domain-containing protein/CheY-like chemotaxis protein n=1 Tax=Roseospira goensis TaxID=391922 RepID=A0A7W6RYI4_9PROT|nr:Hpt domain-containing protein [Roseospira goensis]MBB4284907.1 HPt (histidine-containing phosphotransfer) domain-containing protein/CheY-like chemotaxis protein [Roseospira goensis]